MPYEQVLLAAKKQDNTLLQSALKINSIDVFMPGRYGWTALCQVAFEKDTSAIEFLIKKGANPDSAVWGSLLGAKGDKNHCFRIIDDAFLQGMDVATLASFLVRSGLSDICLDGNLFGLDNSILIQELAGCLDSKKLDIIEDLIITQGASITAAACGAAGCGNTEYANELLARGADKKAVVRAAARGGQWEYLVSLGDDLNWTQIACGAAEAGHIEQLDRFLVSHWDINKNEVASAADESGYNDCARKLRSEVTHLNSQACALATDRNIEELVALIERGADINLAASTAAFHMQMKCVEALQSRGANNDDIACGFARGRSIGAPDRRPAYTRAINKWIRTYNVDLGKMIREAAKVGIYKEDTFLIRRKDTHLEQLKKRSYFYQVLYGLIEHGNRGYLFDVWSNNRYRGGDRITLILMALDAKLNDFAHQVLHDSVLFNSSSDDQCDRLDINKLAQTALKKGHIGFVDSLLSKKELNLISLAASIYHTNKGYCEKIAEFSSEKNTKTQFSKQYKERQFYANVASELVSQGDLKSATHLIFAEKMEGMSSMEWTEFLCQVLSMGYQNYIFAFVNTYHLRDCGVNLDDIIHTAIIKEYTKLAGSLLLVNKQIKLQAREQVLEILGKKDYPDKLKDLLSLDNSGSNINQFVCYFAERNQIKLVSELLSQGASINWAICGHAFSEHKRTVQAYLKQGGDILWALRGAGKAGNEAYIDELRGQEHPESLKWVALGAGEGGQQVFAEKLIATNPEALIWVISGALRAGRINSFKLLAEKHPLSEDIRREMIRSCPNIGHSIYQADPEFIKRAFDEERFYSYAIKGRVHAVISWLKHKIHKRDISTKKIEDLALRAALYLEENGYRSCIGTLFGCLAAEEHHLTMQPMMKNFIEIIVQKYDIKTKKEWLFHLSQYESKLGGRLGKLANDTFVEPHPLANIDWFRVTTISQLIRQDHLTYNAAFTKSSYVWGLMKTVFQLKKFDTLMGLDAWSVTLSYLTDLPIDANDIRRLLFIMERDLTVRSVQLLTESLAKAQSNEEIARILQQIAGANPKQISPDALVIEKRPREDDQDADDDTPLSKRFKESTLKAKTSTGRPIEFTEELVDGSDSNCGFIALGVSREEFVRTLLELMSRSDIREKIFLEIATALAPNPSGISDWQSDIEENQQEWISLYREQMAVEAEMDTFKRQICDGFPSWVKNPMDSQEMQLISLQQYLEENPSIENAREAVNLMSEHRQRLEHVLQKKKHYCCREDITREYVSAFKDRGQGGKHLWLGYEAAAIYAKHKKINLTVWRKKSHCGDELEVVLSVINDSPTNKINMLHTGHFNHFNLLIEKDHTSSSSHVASSSAFFPAVLQSPLSEESKETLSTESPKQSHMEIF